jgi:hypothetical protein
VNTNFDLLSSLAEIAGVFIGFGALIILSGKGDDDAPEAAMVRQVVAIGLLTLVGALVPVGLAQVGLEGLVLWRASSAIFFGLIWYSILHPTSRRLIMAQMRTAPRSAAFFWLVLEPPIQVPLILVMLGLFPERASGLFTLAVVVNLVECAQLLAQVTYARVARTSPAR